MRVIAGRFRRRVLKPVPGMHVRPTPDRLRETLFSILMPRIQGSIFLDAYAGTASVGIEALSRGAKQVILIERRAEALGVIRENLQNLRIGQDEATVLRGAAVTALAGLRCDIAFLDPPYELTNEYSEAMNALGATGCKLAIAQHHSKLALDESYGSFRKTRVVKQGDNSLSFFEPA